MDDGLRPRDLRLGKAVLYQLSYVHIDARTGIEPAYICFAGSDLAFRSHRAVKMKSNPGRRCYKRAVEEGRTPVTSLEGWGPGHWTTTARTVMGGSSSVVRHSRCASAAIPGGTVKDRAGDRHGCGGAAPRSFVGEEGLEPPHCWV